MSEGRRGGIHTLRDLDLLENGTLYPNSSTAPPTNSTGAAGTAAANNSQFPPTIIRHIPGLPGADRALAILQRILREFYPIIQRRGYHVVSVSEMCCCGDGLDYDNEQNENALPRRKGGRRRRRIVSKNILGYNQGSGGSCTIHLRLRDAHNHNQLFPYEDVAGTMSHELAHCEIGPHSADFYKLMDDIQEQHAVFQVRGIVADKGGFPLNSNQAHVLGSTSSNRGVGGNPDNAAAQPGLAAIQRQQKPPAVPPQKLGGNANITQWMPPRQAAAMAAEARRLRDEQWCQPCQPQIIELLDDDDNCSSQEDEEKKEEASLSAQQDQKKAATIRQDGDKKRPNNSNDGKEQQQQPNRKKTFVARPTNEKNTAATVAATDTIDLTATSDDDDDDDVATGRRTATAATNTNDFACEQCTFVNTPPALRCGMCGMETKWATQASLTTSLQLLRSDQINHVKETEVQRSVQDFGGFNIYGSSRKESSTMKHLT